MPERIDEATTRGSETPVSGLRVVLDARLWDGASGGVQQWVLGLAAAFSSLEPSGDEYLFLVNGGREAWLAPFVSGACRIVTTAAPEHRPSPLSSIRTQLAERLPAIRTGWRQFKAAVNRPFTLPISDGTVERLRADVVHFTFQEAFLTAVPSIYQPWDLQHLHLPAFFSAKERARRELSYRAFCAQAVTVVAASKWVKRDLIAQYGIVADRIAVVNVPPVTSAYPEPTPEGMASIRRRMRVPDRFVFFPAQTWPHKNHARLFQALGRLRAEGLPIPLVCSGQRNEHHPAVLRAAREAGIHDDVLFLGFVTGAEVEALYRSARALVFPSLYEGWGLPIVEAFGAGLPVACSNATSLPALVGDAALVFDPYDDEAIATAIRRLWTDDELAGRLAERGRRRVERFSWQRTALTLRAHYRRIAESPMDEQDRELLSADPLV
jgi:glycosyltransferase involved in cell wall biosynthesis